MLVGPTPRDGFTREQTIEIFDLAQGNGDISNKIEIQPTEFNSPITAAYEYLFALPSDATGRYAMAASAKGDDYIRAKSFVPNVDKYATIGDKKGRKIPAGIDATELSVDVDPLTYKNSTTPISATTVRKAIVDRDYETFRASYPQFKDALVKNAWQIVTGLQEALFTKDWWLKQLQEDIDEVFGATMNASEIRRHKHKINKLKTFLDKQDDHSFVYDFEKFPKTVYGVRLTEGGAAGHMAHPWDDHGLTFNDVKEIISRALEGRLDIESAVTEKTDGQNIQVTWKNGQIGFARNKGTVINPMSVQEIQDKFGGRGPISDAFGNAAEDLAEAFSRVSQDKLNQIFKNGRVFANMEIIYPATKNVIAYEVAVLQFHNLIEYDETGNIVETNAAGGELIQRVVAEANKDLEKKDTSGNPIYGSGFKIIPPQQIKLGRVDNFEDQKAALNAEIDQLRNVYGLNDDDLVTDYHKAWWTNVIRTKADQLGYDITDEIVNVLVYRWAFFNKETTLTTLKKMITSPEFLAWVLEMDKGEFKRLYKENMEPFESIFLRLGVVVLKNAQNFLALNPSEAVQQIKTELADLIRELQQSNDVKTLDKLKLELRRIEKLGGFDAIVPSEGIVFVYKGQTFKLTGAFAPVNQILGVLKYSR